MPNVSEKYANGVVRPRRIGRCARGFLAFGLMSWLHAGANADRSQHVQALNDDLVVAIEDGSGREDQFVEFEVSLSQERAVPIRVEWSIAPGTAIEGVDYPPGQGGTLRIPAGTTEGKIRVQTVADRLAEPDDVFTVTLVDVSPIPPDGALLSETDYAATGTIVNDDGDLSVPDAALRVILEDALGKKPGEEITAGELLELKDLRDRSGKSISDLTGLQFAVNLEQFHTHGNVIENLTPLAHLAHLNYLWMSDSQIKDLSPLSKMSGRGSGGRKAKDALTRPIV